MSVKTTKLQVVQNEMNIPFQSLPVTSGEMVRAEGFEPPSLVLGFTRFSDIFIGKTGILLISCIIENRKNIAKICYNLL